MLNEIMAEAVANAATPSDKGKKAETQHHYRWLSVQVQPPTFVIFVKTRIDAFLLYQVFGE